MRVASQSIDRDQWRSIARRQTLFATSIASHFPCRANQLGQVIGACACPQWTTQVRAVGAVEAEIPEPIRGQATAIATLAERFGRRGDDSERQSVRQSMTIGRGG